MNKYTPRIMRHRRGNMNETEWDIQEVKRLKWKQLVQYNVLMLLLFSYYLLDGNSFFLFWSLLCLALWVIVAHSLYTFFTGKMIGTKTMKLVQAFDKNYLGEKHWNKRKLIEVISISAVSLFCTLLVITQGFNFGALEIYNFLPFIGAWLGFNIGEVIRIKRLKE